MHCICSILPHAKQMKEINAETQTLSHYFSQACSLLRGLSSAHDSFQHSSTATSHTQRPWFSCTLKSSIWWDTFTLKEEHNFLDLYIIKISAKPPAESQTGVRFHLSTPKCHVQRQKLSTSPTTYWGDSVMPWEQSTHHWMISVIWASQWATDSFLSARSLISSSSCRLFMLSLSNMAVSWRRI